jgi:hypothetical protein
VQDSTYTVPAGDAASLDLKIDMAVGNLVIDGGTDELLEADLTFNDRLEPEIDWSVESGRGTLSMNQPSAGGESTGSDDRNDWDLRVTAGVPTSLDVNVAAVDTTIELDEIAVARVTAVSASGETIVGIGGAQPALEAVSITGTSGRIWLNLDGVYPGSPAVELRNTSGDIVLDLSGAWQQDVTVTLTNVSGLVQVVVPLEVGVVAEVTTVSGGVVLQGEQPLRQEGNRYVNDAFGISPVTLTLHITTTSGAVALETPG